jgi:adenine-specific DNA-methyltransferase
LQVSRDEKRTTYLEVEGFRVIRFWNHEVLTQTEAVLERILSALES